ncbi:hypothetical protein DMA11_20780 [Marinilabiliaceae bacterium JC017]|nr:hypothetical protein DMA11_20780 [Marinilabiliaceae bacterium JC017]
MNKSIDIFAETNPAFCSLVLYSFIRAYHEESGCPVSFPLLLLPIPIILSGDLESSFNGTNKKTGFFTWLERNPKIRFELIDRIENSMEYIKPAIEYGFFKGIFKLSSKGEIYPETQSVKNCKTNQITKPIFKRAENLGYWLGRINSRRTIFNHLEIQL